MALLPGWNSLESVEKIHSFFESLETVSLAIAIILEINGLKFSSNVAWVVLVISDASRQVYGRREKLLSEQARKHFENRFKARLLTEEARIALKKALNGSAPCRVDVFMFDHESDEVSIFADSLNGTLMDAGFDSVLWVAGGPRMPGNDVVLAIARDCSKQEAEEAKVVAYKIGSVLFSCGIAASHLFGGFAKTEGPSALGGWSRRWDHEDVARLRIQIRAKDLVSRPF